MTSLAIQKHSWNYVFICNPIFKTFAAHFRTKAEQYNDKIIFV